MFFFGPITDLFICSSFSPFSFSSVSFSYQMVYCPWFSFSHLSLHFFRYSHLFYFCHLLLGLNFPFVHFFTIYRLHVFLFLITESRAFCFHFRIFPITSSVAHICFKFGIWCYACSFHFCNIFTIFFLFVFLSFITGSLVRSVRFHIFSFTCFVAHICFTFVIWSYVCTFYLFIIVTIMFVYVFLSCITGFCVRVLSVALKVHQSISEILSLLSAFVLLPDFFCLV